MSSIDNLLNHEAAGGRRASQSQSQQQPPPPSPSDPAYVAHTTYEAADALTTLATLGSGQQYAPAAASTRELPSPTASTHAPPHPRSASFSSHSRDAVAPVEPDPPVQQSQSHSPTLEHYHHGSKSPEEQRRQSISLAAARTSPAPVLAPIQNISPRQTHDGQSSHADEPTPQPPAVKDEPTPTSCATPPVSATQPPTERQPSVTAENIDAETLKAIEIAKQDLGLRVKRNASVAEGITSPTEPKPAPSKKRPAPGSTSTIKKKGTATAKKPSKKRKIDTDGDASVRSVTPTSRSGKNPPKTAKNRSQAGTPVAGSSPAPDHSSQVHPSDDDDSSEDSTLYCICKKPDNHRWMIGCDGGCDDWFHGSCVNMQQADEDLVDKFICPLCEEKGRGQTTYKPMCRRDGCRKPARLTKGKESKYCSDECGAAFFTEQLQRTAGAKAANAKPKKPRKKNGKHGEEAGSDEDDEPTPLGGVLRAKDLKALLEPCKEIQAFKALGSGVLSPPQTASPTQTAFDGPLFDHLSLTAGEKERLTALHKEKSQLKDRLEVLKDREKFVSMAKEQALRVAEREKMKAKDFCGYDSRLSWSDAEFLRWRNSKQGHAAFQFSTLTPTAEQLSSALDSTTSDNDIDMPDHDVNAGESNDENVVCMKKRCQKHPQWQKLNLQDARFEELEIAQSIKECEKEERSVRERARRRGAKDQMAKELTGNGTAGEPRKQARNREGWVEMVQV
ncbi:hypothetical protein DM02DRAFT_561732 [Periconia macrospinosa]|uniref:PHD-type domain-containing protein n=1 Tax=Periconia macrospinosa TaxID=97972 RepID=A0A2V1DWP8_9PLEO|nr:hypothetical protein DM02DRAFT_561732 [Periconia macrospinosa]